MKDKIFKYIFFIISIAIIIIACIFVFIHKSVEITDIQSDNKTFKINKEINMGITNFDTLNPIITKSSEIQYLSKLIFRGLTNISKDFKLKNDLALECSKMDSTTYIIKLKSDIKWHNGDILDAEDVKFTIDNLKKINSIYSKNVEHIENVEVLDSYTIKIYLNEEVNYFEYLLTFPILNKNYYNENTLESKKNILVGNGEYKVISITEEKIVLENEENKINIKIYNDMNKVYLDLKKEEIDLLNTQNINYEDYTGFLGINTNISSGRQFDYLAFNTQDNLLKNVEVRQAINYFIDRKKIIFDIFNNKYLQTNFPINNESYLYKDGGDNYNINQGKKILIDNGWQFKNNVWQKNGNRLQFYLLVNVNNKKRCDVAKAIKQMLEENGILINIIEANDYYYNQKLENKNFDIALVGNILSISPDLNTYFGENNICNFENEEVMLILKDIKNIKDEELLKEKYYRIQEIYAEQMPFVSLYIDTNLILYNSKIKGDFTHNWYNLFYNVNNWYTTQ